jgi:tetratricopeptide (TPR) repeat protein
MKTKEFAFTLPLVVVLYEVMFLQGRAKPRIMFLAPFVFAVLFIPLSLASTDASLSGMAEQMSGVESTGMRRETYLITQFRVIVTYLRLLLFPINQNLDYDYPIFENFFEFEVFISFLLLLSILVLGIYLYRISIKPELSYRYRLRLISFGIFWFFVTIAAESSIIPIADVIYEHRLYLPSLGFFISAIAAADMFAGKQLSLNFSVKNPLYYLFALVVLVLSCATVVRNGAWKDSATLFEEVVHKSPRKARVHYHLAIAYHEQGRIDAAISEYKKALELNLALFLVSDVYNNLGVLYKKQGHLHESVKAYKTALNFKPNDMDVRYNLALVYLNQGLIDDAINELKMILNSKPDDAGIHYYLGVAFAKKGRDEDALSSFQLAQKIDPGNQSTIKNIKILMERAKSVHERN